MCLRGARAARNIFRGAVRIYQYTKGGQGGCRANAVGLLDGVGAEVREACIRTVGEKSGAAEIGPLVGRLGAR